MKVAYGQIRHRVVTVKDPADTEGPLKSLKAFERVEVKAGKTAEADITSKNLEKKQRFLENFDIVDEKIRAVRALDLDRAFRPALDGFDIMAMFGLPQGREVGTLMKELTRVSKDCEIEPTDIIICVGTSLTLLGA